MNATMRLAVLRILGVAVDQTVRTIIKLQGRPEVKLEDRIEVRVGNEVVRRIS